MKFGYNGYYKVRQTQFQTLQNVIEVGSDFTKHILPIVQSIRETEFQRLIAHAKTGVDLGI